MTDHSQKVRERKDPNPLPANHPKYERVKDLSTGAFGFVQLCRNKRSGQLVAIKFLERGRNKITKHVEREVICHSNFCHPHVIQFKEIFLTPTHLAIAMEYAPGGDMFQFVKRSSGLKEEDARWFFQQLMVGLDYCHRMGVVNRDIKLENTLLDASPKPLVKITDFGYCKASNDSLPKSKVGTPGYTAPEVISAKTHYDGTKADIWSCGVMLYVMLFCEYPFERPEDEQDKYGFQKVLDRIMRVDYKIPKYPRISSECRDLIQGILVGDPGQRLDINSIQRHPWYRKGLPPTVMRMNEECLRLRPHDHPGYQTVQEIRAIVSQAIGPIQHQHHQPSDGLESLVDHLALDDSQYF
ncbi:hypothetical protein CVIRNUC_005358 [Coccomyxa viridis]|uniref:Protein kinase domain-containing protein n=1 Tax=Coccomyxa viridis TaxID=1274662 RepID=A0AAV1I7Z6_9CHLO|nr:hypothetical protein CVIRNUC_005358 [Coccomyxa viridis]